MGVAQRVIEELMTRAQHGKGAGSPKGMKSEGKRATGETTDTSGPSSTGTYAMTDLPATSGGSETQPGMDNAEHELIQMPTLDDVATENSSTHGPTRSTKGGRFAGEAPSGDDAAGAAGAGKRPEKG